MRLANGNGQAMSGYRPTDKPTPNDTKELNLFGRTMPECRTHLPRMLLSE